MGFKMEELASGGLIADVNNVVFPNTIQIVRLMNIITKYGLFYVWKDTYHLKCKALSFVRTAFVAIV